MAQAGLELLLCVQSSEMVARDIRSFTLARVDGLTLPPTQAGAHIQVRTPNGALRKYSLCNGDGDTTHYQIAVKRDANGRGGSMSMVDGLREGGTLHCSPPKNGYPLVPSAAGYLFLAGGIGVTPILSMIRTLQAKTTPQGLWNLIYLVRSEADAAFASELRAHPNVTIYCDGGDASAAYDLWPHLESPSAQHIYCCGPSGLMDAVRDMSGHWPEAQIHFESFLDASGARTSDTAFDVHLKKSARTIHVPADTTLLQALRHSEIAIASSCESGTCGTCRTTLLLGNVDHRDFVLSPEEHTRCIMPCVSRAKQGALTLDL
jgi:phthalate 4,5-dioxygenase reductase component